MKINYNRLSNVNNKYQGGYSRVLVVCSAGLLRSPTIAEILAKPPFNFNTRAVGYSTEYALIPLDACHVAWADKIVCVDIYSESAAYSLIEEHLRDKKPVYNLEIEDIYAFRDPELIDIATKKLTKLFGVSNAD